MELDQEPSWHLVQMRYTIPLSTSYEAFQERKQEIATTTRVKARRMQTPNLKTEGRFNSHEVYHYKFEFKNYIFLSLL
ncbi:hypothetical protein AAZX31_07G156000 [Glycine max]